jgi:hypothetical protein
MTKPKATVTTLMAKSRRRRAAKPKETRAGRLLKELTIFYLNSGDFNGFRALQLADRLGQSWNEVKRTAAALIEKELIGVLDEKSDVNPAILRLDFEQKDIQLEKLNDSNLEHTFIYPRTAHLQSVVNPSDYAGRPYLLELALGHPQFSFRSFDLSVLEFYRNDPRYMYENRDIDGLISIRDEYYQSNQMAEKDQILLESFGFSFDKNLNRAVAVFLRYLARLSPEHQQIWKAKQLTGAYRLHRDYLNYTIIGDWGEGASIFVAFCAEMHLLNVMAEALGRGPFFRQTFGAYGESKPKRFTFLVRPTLEEFNQFALLLDKMISDNINKDFFQKDVPLETEAQRADGKIVVQPKGTLTLLNDWLRYYFRTNDWEPWDEAFRSLREVRRLRQHPAHAVDEDVFDQKYIRDQRQLIIDAYKALRTLRLMFMRDPKAKDAHLAISDWLAKGQIWTL